MRSTRFYAAAFALALAGSVPVPAPAGAQDCANASPLDPEHRTRRLQQEPAGVEKTFCIFSGPYTIPPGQDLSRVDIDLSMADGYIVAGGPSLTDQDGVEPSRQDIHVHHAHWWRLDPDAKNYGPSIPLPGWQWIAGAGEEYTEGNLDLVSASEPAPTDGTPRLRYGLQVHNGDRVLLIDMVHNKSAQARVVWIKIGLTFLFGTHDKILAANNEDVHSLTPVLFGGTFDVIRGTGSGGTCTFPFSADACGNTATSGSCFFTLYCTSYLSSDIKVGRGRLWQAPFDGTIVIGASHLHPGGEKVILTNAGEASSPCPDRSDGIPGTTLMELRSHQRNNVPFSEDFQIDITQPGYRADIKTGDRLYLNGVYESAEHTWYEAMAFTGFYVDQHPVVSRDCAPRVVGRPSPDWVPPLMESYPDTMPAWEGVPNRQWGRAQPVCLAACDGNLPAAPAAPQPIDQIVVSGFQYVPGNLGHPYTPIVRKGTLLRVSNTDMGAYIRHTVTSCRAPCDGPYVANYPLPDGSFDTRALGYEVTGGGNYAPTATIDTSSLSVGVRYTYFCRMHAWMRGSLEIV